jgi:hypothetical protein
MVLIDKERQIFSGIIADFHSRPILAHPAKSNTSNP